MHAGVLPNGNVFFLDKVENYTQLTLPDGQYAYSSEYDPVSNSAVGLAYLTNAFCSGGAPLADGRIMSVGGNFGLPDIDPTVGNGIDGIRYVDRSPTDRSLDGQAWSEPGNKLASARWYPSVQMLPDGRFFVASGSLNGADPNVAANNNPTYEILDRDGVTVDNTSVPMALLAANQPYYMYPFVHLLSNGQLFVFVAKSSEVFDVDRNQTVTRLPDLDGDYRTYPNTGTSILLPLSSANGYAPDIVVCGGGPYQDISAPTDASCGRIQPLGNSSSSSSSSNCTTNSTTTANTTTTAAAAAATPTWELDAMPQGRCMVEANLLLDGTVLFLSGANQGAQGFGEATDPTLEALLYDPAAPLGSRWARAANSTVPRLYHSVSLMLLDGSILVAGSNPVQMPVLAPSPANPFVTEFRVERYTPPYLVGDKAALRPTDVTVHGNATVPPAMRPGGKAFGLAFGLPSSSGSSSSSSSSYSNATTTTAEAAAAAAAGDCRVVLYQVGFVTHSLHMGHRMVYLDHTGFRPGAARQVLRVRPPPSSSVVPPGYYMLFVVVGGVPSWGQMVMVSGGE
jgi:hypothetical protein